MYDLIDRPVATLPSFERGLLERTRRWVHAFSVAGTDLAVDRNDPLATAMRALDRGSSDDIVIQRPCFATVDETEAVILSLWRLVRDGRHAEAAAIAGLLVDPTHVSALLNGMVGAIA